ncbi:hypothetical protein LBMAG52_33100 [Planctomycetia bacterium]|nr:hypothetical protein LBMAG52_33100 [Planctomycetia bacterium]
MTRQTWDDENEDWGDDESDLDGESTIICPHCGTEVYEDSPRCPSCENYLSLEDVPATVTNKPWWVLLGAGLGLLVFLRWLFV